MDPELDNAVRRIRFGDMVNAYFPFINLDAFGAAYPEDLLRRIHIKLQDTVHRRPVDDARHKETILSEAWLDVDVVESLSPGYILNIFEDHADQTTHRNKQKNYYGALISKSDKHLAQQDQPNYFLDDLSFVFKRGGGQHDPWDTTDVVDSDSRSDALDQLESHAARHFYFQHRTGLFMLFVNGGEFRVIRWDRSGCIVTEALNYVESADHTKKLLQFLYVYSQATPEQRGMDTTATQLSKDSCGWQWMQKLAVAHAKDLDCADNTVLDSLPEGFVMKATGDAPASPLFATNVLADDPTATMGFADLSSLGDTSALVAPVFKYVRDLFRASFLEEWTCYRLNVCGRDYLVGKPTFSRQGMVGRGTRGYVALEWKTQRFVFLKDVWRYSRWDIDRTEGETLKILNDADVPFVPTLVCDEDVHGGKQVTHASEHSAPGTKKDRPIAPLPSRPLAALSPSATPQDDPTPTASTPPMGQKPFAAKGDGSGKDLKRPRPETTTPVEPSDKNRSSCRRFTHYRIVVAEVCMPSSAFTSGMQLVRVLWTCITGHRCAAKRCNMLHCDISTGNIFILPMVHVLASKRSTKGEKKTRVLWCGILGDWELAKKCPDAHEMSQSGRRLKQRAGTWYFMSVYAVNNPNTPISIADELESFFHVLLYLAIRYLRSTLRSRGPGIFIDAYFDSWGKDGDGTLMCPIVKGNIVYYGQLAFNRKPIAFLPDPQHPNSESDEHDEPVVDASHPPSPLNHLILVLLDHFKAHYAVRSYNEECKVRNEARKVRKLNPPGPPRDSNIDTATPNTADADKESDAQAELDWLLSMREFFGGRPRRTPPEDIKVVLRRAPPEPPEPSAEEQAKSARLATHAYVEDLFFSLIGGRILWPKKDHVGDQLEGFVYPGYSRFGVGNSTTSSDEEGDGEESVISDWDD